MGSIPYPTISSIPPLLPMTFQSTPSPGSGYGSGHYGRGGYGVGDSGLIPTLMGTINGTNAVFTMGVVLRKASVFRNGQCLTQNYDYAWGSNVVVFMGSQIPQPGDVLKVVGWPL